VFCSGCGVRDSGGGPSAPRHDGVAGVPPAVNRSPADAMTPASVGLAEPGPASPDPTSNEHDEDVAGTTPVVRASAVRYRQEADPVAAWRTGTVDPADSGGRRRGVGRRAGAVPAHHVSPV
jgi:hypothetical protein